MAIKNYIVKGQGVDLKFEEFEIDWNGKKEMVEMRELAFGEDNDLNEDCIETKFVGAQPMFRASPKKRMEVGVLKSLVKAPFPIDLIHIQSLSKKLGNLLYNKFEKLNEEEQKKSETSNTTSTESQ